MLSSLRNLFGNSKPRVDVEWLRKLGESDIFVLSATVSEGIDAKTITQDQLLAEIREAIERDKENQKRGYGVFIYTSEGKRRLPFFTSNKHVETFCGEYSKERNRVYPFMWLQTKGTFLAKIIPSSCDLIVMNDKSKDERVLST
jgi:hypothetical protein